MSLASCSSRTAFAISSRRLFATQSSSTVGSSNAPATDKGKRRETKESSPLYKDSNAASRPRPNRRSSLFAKPPLVARTLRKDRAEGDEAESSRDTGFSLSAAAHAALNTPQAQSDEQLTRFYRFLAGTPADATTRISHTLEACQNIKKRLAKYHSVDGKVPKPPFLVFVAQLERFANGGEVEMCSAVIDDMKELGYTVSVETWNYALKAAVTRGLDEEVEDVLSQIASLNEGVEGEAMVDPSTTTSSSRPILSREWTKNWTVHTYQHLLRYCRHKHNIEYSMALLASASHKRLTEGDEATFLSLILNLQAVVDVIATVAHSRESRLAIEVAQWIDTRIGTRKLNANNWMTILRSCAQEHYMPGVEIAWEEAVVKRYMSPDDGLIVLILVTASRANNSAFIKNVLKFHEVRLATINASLQEWHLMPLFQSQCADYDFVGALKTSIRIVKASSNPQTLGSMIDLRHRASVSRERLKESYEAMMTVGRDQSLERGICLAAYNNILRAAVYLGDSELVFKIYRSRKLIRSDISPPSCSLPPDTESSVDTGHNEEAIMILNMGEPDDDPSTANRKRINTVIADIETYNLLLLFAIREESEELGTTIYQHLNAARVKADERTYELGIRLALMRKNYQPAFLLLEECKKRNIVPSNWAYLNLANKCWAEDDPRWIDLTLEMLEVGHGCGEEFYKSLAAGGHLDQISKDTKNRLDIRYHRERWDYDYVPRNHLDDNIQSNTRNDS